MSRLNGPLGSFCFIGSELQFLGLYHSSMAASMTLETDSWDCAKDERTWPSLITRRRSPHHLEPVKLSCLSEWQEDPLALILTHIQICLQRALWLKRCNALVFRVSSFLSSLFPFPCLPSLHSISPCFCACAFEATLEIIEAR